MKDVSFAAGTPADFDAVRALLERCALPTQDLEPARLGEFILCRVRGAVAGSVGLEAHGKVALLRSLAVEPELRGEGLGHRLWGRAQEEARKRGIRQLYLLTTTAEGLFARWGFRSVPREQVPPEIQGTHEYGSLCPSTATVMALEVRAEAHAGQPS